jgi:hypothetical protein
MPDGDLPAYALAAFLGTAGVTHFTKPDFYDPIVPRALPGEARTWTYVSGAAELTVAALVATRRTRALGGLLAAACSSRCSPATSRWRGTGATDRRTGRRVRTVAAAGTDGLWALRVAKRAAR